MKQNFFPFIAVSFHHVWQELEQKLVIHRMQIKATGEWITYLTITMKINRCLRSPKPIDQQDISELWAT
jgi:hypothetical protein